MAMLPTFIHRIVYLGFAVSKPSIISKSTCLALRNLDLHARLLIQRNNKKKHDSNFSIIFTKGFNHYPQTQNHKTSFQSLNLINPSTTMCWMYVYLHFLCPCERVLTNAVWPSFLPSGDLACDWECGGIPRKVTANSGFWGAYCSKACRERY